MKLTLPTDSAARKNYPVADGPLSYFPAAIAGVALVCKLGNDKHNPGEPLHHARGKSGDHANCIVRHLMDVNDARAHLDRSRAQGLDVGAGMPATVAVLLMEANQLAWRALALSQEIHETYGGAPLAPGARLPDPVPPVAELVNKWAAPLMDFSHEIPGPAGADWRERPEAVDRATWPPISDHRMAPDALWSADGKGWYFNRHEGCDNPASNTEYRSEAAARSAYWADRDAQP